MRSLHKDVFERIEKNTFYYIIMDGKVDASEKPLRNEMAGYRRNMQTKCILLLLWYAHSFHFHWSQLTKWLRSSRAVAVTFDANKAKWQERTFFTICKLVSFSIHSLTLGILLSELFSATFNTHHRHKHTFWRVFKRFERFNCYTLALSDWK